MALLVSSVPLSLPTAAGYKADINVIDLDRLSVAAPHPVHDLPGGGRRLEQKAEGYRAAIVGGAVTYRDGTSTGALPGRLVRGVTLPPTFIHWQLEPGG